MKDNVKSNNLINGKRTDSKWEQKEETSKLNQLNNEANFMKKIIKPIVELTETMNKALKKQWVHAEPN